MIALIFVCICAGWGLLLGSLIVAVLTSDRRMIEISIPSSSGSMLSCAYWTIAGAAFIAMHFNYVDEDVIGGHTLAAVGFYFGAALPFLLGSKGRRALVRKVR